ncbi:MAG: hypothetical protein BGO05_24525 [Rhizobiales bacterium 63-7]|nr:MAG: hypothetical protein BGO05_24525 [Rhizobiales bacterium 63-7]
MQKTVSLKRQFGGLRRLIEGLADKSGVELVDNDPEARIQTNAELIEGGFQLVSAMPPAASC